MTDKKPYQAMSEALSEMAETVTITEAELRKIIAKEVAKARKGEQYNGIHIWRHRNTYPTTHTDSDSCSDRTQYDAQGSYTD